MIVPGAMSQELGNLELRIARHVEDLTWSSVRNLRVEVQPERVAITGQTNSYYRKQLAWLAVREVLQQGGLEWEVDVAIEVVVPPRRPTDGRN